MEATDIYSRIKQAREHSGLTQSSLAMMVGVKRSSANQWESSALRKEPCTVNLIKIAEITGVSFEWLATGRGEMAWEVRVSESTPEYNQPTPRELLLLRLFRKLPERKQKALVEFLSGD